MTNRACHHCETESDTGNHWAQGTSTYFTVRLHRSKSVLSSGSATRKFDYAYNSHNDFLVTPSVIFIPVALASPLSDSRALHYLENLLEPLYWILILVPNLPNR